jgi:hypothetical protein
MPSKQERIATHIAQRIVRNKTRKGFSTLYAEALQEIPMSEINATGDPNAGPMSPEATKTRGESQREATGSSDTNGMTVGSQVSNVLAHKVDASDAAEVNTNGVQKPNTL